MTNTLDNQNTPDEIDEILNNLLRNGLQHMHPKTSPDEVLKMYVGSDDYNAYKHILLALITAARDDVYWQILHYVEPNSELQAVILRLQKESTLTNDKIGGEHGGLERRNDEK